MSSIKRHSRCNNAGTCSALLLMNALLIAPVTGFLLPRSASHVILKSAPSSTYAPSVFYAAAEDATITNDGASSYIRWKTKSSSSSDVWELQTAVTTFQRTNPETKQPERVELHAQVHYGTQDYFEFYNSPAFVQQQDEVLYELLVDDQLLGLAKDKSGRVLTHRLQASPNDESVANDYGWQCQVNVMDYTQANWKHADFTSQELLQQQQQQSSPAVGDTNRPLWQQVSAGTAIWQPAVSALLVGPPSLFVASDTDATTTKRKLFTNLFLPGNQLTGWLRACLWMTVPAPEISVLLLDWSSLFLSKNSAAKFSPVTLPILQCVAQLRLAQLRQLVFGQVLVSGNSAATQQKQQNQDWNLLVTQRNDHALRTLRNTLQSPKKKKQMALLYGCSHCPDLHSKLVADEFGFTAIKTEWRTAWSVSVPNTFDGEEKEATVTIPNQTRASSSNLRNDLFAYLPPTAWAALVALFPLYLGVGAVDWIDTIHSSAVSLLDNHDPVAFGGDWMLYLLRHVLLYILVSKFALEWQDPKQG